MPNCLNFIPVCDTSQLEPNYTLIDGIAKLKWQSACLNQGKDSFKHRSKISNTVKIFNNGMNSIKKSKATIVETQTLYFADLCSGRCGLIQLLYSNVLGGMYKTFQLNLKVCQCEESEDDVNIWESFKIENVRHFSEYKVQSEHMTFEIKETDDGIATLSIIASLSKSKLEPIVQINLSVTLGVGFEINPEGSSFYLSKRPKASGTPRKRLRHIFVPGGKCNGKINYYKGDCPIEIEFSEVPILFVGALHSLSPIKAARKWNFAFFQSQNYCGVCMEYTSTPNFGDVTVTISALSYNNEISSIYASSMPAKTHVNFLKTALDRVNNWKYPTAIRIPLGDTHFLTEDRLRLVNRYDVLNELPNVVKSVVANVAGVKPCIYQFCQRSDFANERGLSIIESTFIS